MKNKPNQKQAMPPAHAPDAEWDDAWLERQSVLARAYHELGMLDEAEAELQLLPEAPQRWHEQVQVGLGQIAWARGDMKAVVEVCYPWQHLVPQRQFWFSMVAAALKNCGRIPEAIALQERGMTLNGASPTDFYNLACFHTQARNYHGALSMLVQGLNFDGFHRFKALLDNDLQPLWYHLSSLSTDPETRELMASHHLAHLGNYRFDFPPEIGWDPADFHNLPAAFGPHLIYSRRSGLFIMDPVAPARVKLNFQKWSRDRARATQRMIRGAIGNHLDGDPS